MIENDRGQRNYSNYWYQLGILFLSFQVESVPVFAQVVPDRTLGASSSVVKQITPQLEQIEGGAVRGSSLFHSFSEFNIGNGYRSDFVNPSGITNIFSRVTGANPSLLFGTLGVLGNANLFLLNPNGIIFGQNAKLDLNGAFVATTANQFGFGAGGSFGTIDPAGLPILTVDTPVPISLQFNQTSGSIVNGGDLGAKPGQSLILAGGSIASTGTITASGGQVGLITGTNPNAPVISAGIGQPVSVVFGSNLARGTSVPDLVSRAGSDSGVVVNADRSIQVGKASGVVQPGDILVNTVDTSSKIGNGGGVLINASGQIQIPGSIDASSYQGAGIGGRIDLISPAGLTLDNSNGCNGKCVYSETSGAGSGGELNVRTRSLTVANGAMIGTRSRGVGNAGNLTVVAPDLIEVSGTPADSLVYDSGLFASCGATCSGQGGEVNIQTNKLIARDGGFISAITLGKGNAGNIRVNADTIELRGAPVRERESGLWANSEGGGGAGNINVQTRQLLVADSGQITVDTLATSTGAAGNISIDATESVTVSGMAPYLGSKPTGIFTFTGNDRSAGVIDINTPKLVMRDGASISAGTDGAGKGGAIRINATESVQIVGSAPLDGNGTRLRSITSNAGNGGDIIINTPQLEVAAGARIDNRTGTGTGNGGNIQVNAQRVNISSGGQLISSTEGQGAAGKIEINAAQGDVLISGVDASYAQKAAKFPRLIINEGASSGIVTRANQGSTGKGGDIQIQARNVELRDRAQLISTTAGAGDSGSIRVAGAGVKIQDRSNVTVNSQGTGIAGNISIAANSLTLAQSSKITAQTTATNGGNIRLDTRDLLRLRGDSEISTTAGTAQAGGNGGDISIAAPLGLIVADPAGVSGNDITANAYTGNGGQVNLTAQGLLGLIFRPGLTALNDITASSAFGLGGVVEIDTPAVDPSRGLSVLPLAIRTVGVVEGCQASSGAERVAYFDVGRGGMATDRSGGADWIDVGGNSHTVAGGMSKLSVNASTPRSVSCLH